MGAAPPAPVSSLLPAHQARTWRVVRLDGHGFIYAESGTLICMVPKQDAASADFIVRACHHHDELVRMVKAAAYMLADCDEFAWPGLGVSRVLAQAFCRQATEVLHTIGAQPS